MNIEHQAGNKELEGCAMIYEEKVAGFCGNHKINEEPEYRDAAKTYRILVCVDLNTFFPGASFIEHFRNYSGNGFKSAGNVGDSTKEYYILYDKTDG